MATIKLGQPDACARCGRKPKALFRLKTGQHESRLCQECYDDWFEIRDGAVKKAFDAFLAPKAKS